MSNRNRLVEWQSKFNSDSRVAWQPMRLHRQHVTSLLCQAAGTEFSRLCVLGAGNCNDLDLPQLINTCAEIHLVDVDGAALANAVTTQQLGHLDQIVLHGGCDLTGIWDSISSWSPQQPVDDRQLDCVLSAAQSGWTSELPGRFEVVASVCLLSQLIGAIVGTLGEQHPRFLELVRVVRHRHLQMLAELAAPGGVGLLITDVVSSTAAPEITSVTSAQLPALLTDLIRSKNFFHGLNPAVLADLFRNDPVISPMLLATHFLSPWVWDFGVRQYAVVGIQFQRAGERE